MKHIVKGPEPAVFSNWKSMATEDWQPTYGTMQSDIKQAVKQALMAEQGYICCYCERRLTDEDSHIEHFQPQRDPAVDPLDFSNMLCSCQNRLKKGEPRHCGNRKGDWFDPDLLVSPLDPGCESRFAFTGDGRIRPSDNSDLAAAETISQLELNITKLNSMRANAIEPFLDETISNEQFQKLVTGYLAEDITGPLSEFWTTIRYLFGGVVTA